MMSPRVIIHAPSTPRTGAAEPCDWASRGPLMWEHPDPWKSEWTLRAGTESLATLRRDHWYGRAMTATTPRGTWKLKRRWTGRVEVRHDDAEEPALVYDPGWIGRGTILRPRKASLLWRRPRFFSRVHEVRTDESFTVLRVRPARGILRHRGSVEFETASRNLDDLEPLVLLAWALQLTRHRKHAH